MFKFPLITHELLTSHCSNQNNEPLPAIFHYRVLIQLCSWATARIQRICLLSKFAFLSNKNVLTSQIENLHQEQNESLTQYTERARRLLRKRNSIYSHLTEEQRTENNRLVRRAFSKSILNGKLRDKIMTRGASSLEDTIAFVIEAENDALTEIPRMNYIAYSATQTGTAKNFVDAKNPIKVTLAD